MSHHVDADLVCYVLGTLSADDCENVSAHVEQCSRCTGMLATLSDELAQLALALEPAKPPAMLRETLLHASAEVSRFTDWLEPVGRRLQLQRSEAEAILDDLDVMSRWEDSSAAGLQIYAVPERAGAYFLRVVPGHPVHSHEPTLGGPALILQGTCRNVHGKIFGAGDTLMLAVESDPAYVALAGTDVICLLTDEHTPGGGVQPTP